MIFWSFSLWQARSLTAAQAPRGLCPAPTHPCRVRPWLRAWQLALQAVCPIRRVEQGARQPPAPATSSFHSRLRQASRPEASFSIRIQVSALPLLWQGLKIRVLFLCLSLQIRQQVFLKFHWVGSWFRKSRSIAVISISILISILICNYRFFPEISTFPSVLFVLTMVCLRYSWELRPETIKWWSGKY